MKRSVDHGFELLIVTLFLLVKIMNSSVASD